MKIYADFEFYKSEYLGKTFQNEQDFSFYALRATEFIDAKTFGRIADVTQNVKMACCSAADEMYINESVKNTAASGISSESVSGYSVSYRAYDTKADKAAERRITSAIKRYLGDTGLMYRGNDE